LYVVVHKDCNASFYHRAAAAELSPAGGGGDGSGGGDEGRWWFCAAAVVEAWPLCYAIAAAESVENRMGTSPDVVAGEGAAIRARALTLTLFAPLSTSRFPATVARGV